MKKLSILIFAMLLATAVSAQVAPAESEAPDRIIDKAKEMQFLTTNQLAILLAINILNTFPGSERSGNWYAMLNSVMKHGIAKT